MNFNTNHIILMKENSQLVVSNSSTQTGYDEILSFYFVPTKKKTEKKHSNMWMCIHRMDNGVRGWDEVK